MITLYSCGPAFGLPEASPYVTKTEIQLRMAGLPYVKEVASPDTSPKGQLPWIDDDGTKVADSTFIRTYLELTYGLDFDEALTPVERAQAWKLRPESLDVEESDQEIDDETLVLQAALRRDLNHQLDFLDDTGRAILRLRYGLAGRPPATLEETAHQLDLPPDQIQPLEREALRFLRRRCQSTLRDYAA